MRRPACAPLLLGAGQALSDVVLTPSVYSHPCCSATAGLRQVELDCYPDPKGGLFAAAAGRKLAGEDGYLPIPALKNPGWKVRISSPACIKKLLCASPLAIGTACCHSGADHGWSSMLMGGSSLHLDTSGTRTVQNGILACVPALGSTRGSHVESRASAASR